jgi:hypothetical protein
MQNYCDPESKDLSEDNAFYFLSYIFQKRSTASGDNGCKLTQFTRNISKFDCYFGLRLLAMVKWINVLIFDHD